MASAARQGREAAAPEASPGALARRWCEEIFDRGRLDSVDELLAADGVIHDGGLAARSVRSPSDFKEQVTALRSAFPDLRMEPKEMACEGELVAFHCRVSGTHLGDGLGIPATGRFLEICGMSMGRWRDGRLVEGWNHYDLLTLYRRLGVLRLFDPPPRSDREPA